MVSRQIYMQPRLAQQLFLSGQNLRMEGVAFREDGNVIASALSDGNKVVLFRKDSQGKNFEHSPFCELGGDSYDLTYPHDVAFSLKDNGGYLAVALRSDKVAFFRQSEDHEGYHPQPVQVLDQESSGLNYSDGVTFVPPTGNWVAVCNTVNDEITLFKCSSESSEVRLDPHPIQTIQGGALHHPDGLGCTSCGNFMAAANHHANNVAIFSVDKISGRINPEPVQVINDKSLVFPHSVQFTPRYKHLLVTCAGVNYINVYLRNHDSLSGKDAWSSFPDQQLLLGDKAVFSASNIRNTQEGGPKGIAISDKLIAFCREETGTSMYRYEEKEKDIVFPINADFWKDRVFIPNNDWVLEQDNESLLLANTTKMRKFSVNQSGALVFSLCDGMTSIGDIVQEVSSLYPDGQDVADDITETVLAFARNEILEENSFSYEERGSV